MFDFEVRLGLFSIVVVLGLRLSEEEFLFKFGLGIGFRWFCVIGLSWFFLYSYILYIWIMLKVFCEFDDLVILVVINEFEKYFFFYVCKRCE